MKKVLLLGSHADDIELGCGGFMSRFAGECNFEYAVLSGYKGKRRDEMFEAAGHLHIKGIITFKLQERTFPQNRQQVLQILHDLNQSIQPDIVFTHSTNDIHQDHSTLTNEAKRIFKNCTLLGYEFPWNDIYTSNDLFITLTESQVSRKIEALKMYHSQQYKPFMNDDVIRSIARVRGLQSGSEYAEMFEVIRMVI